MAGRGERESEKVKFPFSPSLFLLLICHKCTPASIPAYDSFSKFPLLLIVV
jgi:hypothetical protein